MVLLTALAVAGSPDPEATLLLWALAILLVLLGLVGTVVPAIPGVPLVFLGLLMAAWADGFHKVGWITLSLLGVLTLLSFAIELWAVHRGTRRFGASPLAVAGALLGALGGLFFSLPGLLLGPFVGAFAGELLARRGWKQAGRAGLGTWLGMMIGVAVRLALVFAMLGLFATAYVL
ncbi:MAG: DUF456 domain-containing protein [Acidobacteriota bacterium]|nr:DUF456 domain-containing protein [Acidobacteriota bacterium]